MSPTLNRTYDTSGQSDTILVVRDPPLAIPILWRLMPGLHRSTLSRGDVVLFRKPFNPEGLTVKRVIGLPGDRIERDPRLVAHGDKNGRRYGFAAVPAKLSVPAGHVFVEGDNWRNSLDSNDFGTIPINLITGRVVRTAPTWWSLVLGKGETIAPKEQNRRSSKTNVIQARVIPDLDEWENVNY
jgi:mitochondrial inner membrane protease subunit 2